MLHIHWQTIETTKCDVTTAVNPIIEISTDRQTDTITDDYDEQADERKTYSIGALFSYKGHATYTDDYDDDDEDDDYDKLMEHPSFMTLMMTVIQGNITINIIKTIMQNSFNR